MAEIKNNFIRSKMNKDLDRRLIPNGEYINAINSQISMSEGDGVGTLENMLGNELVSTLITPTIANLISIGYFVDQVNNFIYVFLTDNYTSSYNPTGIGSNHFICRYSPSNNTTTTLVTGAFLNFSTLNPIYGVNLLENLLFFTDNRNQPRKINVTNAANSISHYQTEDQISVAKYNPYNAIYLYEASTAFAGDFESTMKDVVSKFMPTGGSGVVNATGTSNAFILNNGIFPFYPNKPAQGQSVGLIPAIDPDGPITMLNVTVSGNTSSTLVTLSNTIALNAGDQLIFFPNPYYNNTYAGDSTFLEDKFVRFSYRFKFEDNEYSLVAPFTQPCFIPKQDGYFLSKETNGNVTPNAVIGDQVEAAESSIVSFMENKVNSIDLQIPLPSAQNTLASDFKITEIEVLYKESDGLVIKAVDAIKVSTLTSADNFVEYVYEGKKPFKTLLEKETARVFDKVPVKSLAQEVSGNRVIYSNFQNRHTPPLSLDYNINVTPKAALSFRTGTALASAPVNNDKTVNIKQTSGTIEVGSKVSFSGAPANLLVQAVNNANQIVLNQNVTLATDDALTFDPATNDQNTTSIIEYPSSSLKTNRSYQVGVVLSDKYGRTSDVILSSNEDLVSIGDDNFSGSSLYSEYQTQDDQNADVWPGNSLKVLFNSVIGPENPSGFYPGIYNGAVDSESYNPLGWYSYKIVVQQKEQDYYNVYAPGAIKGDVDNNLQPLNTPGAINTLNPNTSRIVLINDNVNKVPRDLSEVGPQDKTFRSSVQLFGRVVNNLNQYMPSYDINNPTPFTSASSTLGNQQYYPDQRTFTTNTIQPLFDSVDWPDSFFVTLTDGGGVPVGSKPPTLDTSQPIYSFYNSEANPFIATITTSALNNDNYQFGAINPYFNTLNMTYTPVNQLCVLETKPVMSLLDIYYETSTSGLINDLNLAILNDIGISNTFNNFNFNNFTEALKPNDFINTGSFTIVDEFTQQLEEGTSAIGQYQSFTLTSAFNQEDPSQDVTSYFQLVGTENPGGSNLYDYKIKVTQDFVDNVYFGINQFQRVFTLSFLVKVVTEVSPSLVTQDVEFTETISLGNENPVIYSVRSQPPQPSDVAPSSTTINPLFNTINLAEFYGRNGAFPGDSTYNTNPNTAKDLEFSIVSVTNTTTGGVLVEPYPFALEQSIPQPPAVAAPFVRRCIVKNNLPSPGTIKAAEYAINLRLTDADNDSANIILNVVYGTPASLVEEVAYTFPAQEARNFVRVKFDVTGFTGNGWYLYSGSWDHLTGPDSQYLLGNSTIQISGALGPTSPGPNDQNYFNRWWYGGTQGGNFDLSLENIEDRLKLYHPEGPYNEIGVSGVINPGAQNGAGYAFEIL